MFNHHFSEQQQWQRVNCHQVVSLWTSWNALFRISTEKARPLSTQFLFSKRDDGRIPCLGSVHSEWSWEDKLEPSICTTGHGLKEDLFDEGEPLNDTGSTCNRSQSSENSIPLEGCLAAESVVEHQFSKKPRSELVGNDELMKDEDKEDTATTIFKHRILTYMIHQKLTSRKLTRGSTLQNAQTSGTKVRLQKLHLIPCSVLDACSCREILIKMILASRNELPQATEVEQTCIKSHCK